MTPGKQTEHMVTVTVGEADDKQDVTIPFLVFVPETYAAGDARWPLLLFLHGLGESGDGQLDRVKRHGPPKIVERRPDFPFVVVSPQCPRPTSDYARAWQSEPLVELLNYSEHHLRVDPARVYVTGLSMGGYGTWRLAAACPDRFAAAVPICGGGDPGTAGRMPRLPVWCFHGARDNVVPLRKSQEMVDALKKADGNVRLTVYPKANHDSWTRTYDNPQVYEWLLEHRRLDPNR